MTHLPGPHTHDLCAWCCAALYAPSDINGAPLRVPFLRVFCPDHSKCEDTHNFPPEWTRSLGLEHVLAAIAEGFVILGPAMELYAFDAVSTVAGTRMCAIHAARAINDQIRSANR